MMPRTKPTLLDVFLALSLFVLALPSSPSAQSGPAWEWNLLYPRIRDRLIAREEAQAKLKRLEDELRTNDPKTQGTNREVPLGFPVKGYGASSIGGKQGSGYQIQGYDFFDGNQHKGHPGHDIFIIDKNQDGLDDRTGNPVEVISVSLGIVVSVNTDWRPPSVIRGGNSIWIFDPPRRRYYYYAHLNEIFVAVGQVVSKGDRLGTVGRTGLNAYPARSPTHLHFTVHESAEGYPKPINPYRELLAK